MKHKFQTVSPGKLVAGLVLVVLLLANVAVDQRVFASTAMTKATVMEYNMNASGTSSFAIAFTAGASDVAGTLTINFGSWGGTVATSQTVATTGCTTLTGASTALPGSITAAGASSTVTISSVGALTSGTSYCAILTSTTAVTNPGAGVYPVILTDATDSTTVAIDVIANDQVVVSATVPPSFTLALSGNTDGFTSNLASGSVVGTTGITATVNTNAKSGWFLWGSDANTGLRSTSLSYTIASKTPGTNATLTAGTEGYVTAISGITQGTGAGTTSAATAYTSSGTGNGSGLNTTQTQIASSTGTANGAIVPVKEYAAISGTTPAATDYADTITLVGAGSF
jgi:hypothetical protein